MVVFRGNVLGAQVPAAETPAPSSPEASPFVVNPPLDNPFMVNPPTANSPTPNTPVARAPASSAIGRHRRSARIAKKLLNVSQDAVESDEDIESPIVSSRSRKRKQEEDPSEQDGEENNTVRKKRTRGRPTKQASQRTGRQAATGNHDDIAQILGHIEGSAHRIRSNLRVTRNEEIDGQPLLNEEEQEAATVISEITQTVGDITFDDQYPMPAGATSAEIIALMRLLQRRNNYLRAAEPDHRSARDAEYEYRIMVAGIVARGEDELQMDDVPGASVDVDADGEV